MEVWLTFLVGSVPLLVWWLWWWNEIWYVFPVKARFSRLTTKLPPGHLGFPLFGQILTFYWYFKIVRRPDDFVNYMRRKYGENVGAYRTYLYGSPSIMCCSPSLIKFVLKSSDEIKQEWPVEVVGSSSILALQGAHHHRVKSLLLNVISLPDALGRIALQVQPSLVVALHSWAQKGKITAFNEIRKLTFETMGRYFAHFEAGPQLDALEKVFAGVARGFRAQRWNFPGTAYYHAVQCRKKVTKLLKEELEKRKQSNKQTETFDSTSDLMDVLMHMKDEEGKHLQDEEIVDNVVSSIQVGYLSISYLVTWSLYFLAKSPHVLEKLQEENKAISMEKKGEYITYDDISKLKYTNKVVEETIRMANVSSFVIRKATHDVEFKGYVIPKGWKVFVWLRHLHTDPENFEDPTCFNPDRWDKISRPGTYLPFGRGVTTCPGSSLTRVHLAIFLHHLSVGYRWELLNPDAAIRYLSHPMPTDGLEISISKI